MIRLFAGKPTDPAIRHAAGDQTNVGAGRAAGGRSSNCAYVVTCPRRTCVLIFCAYRRMTGRAGGRRGEDSEGFTTRDRKCRCVPTPAQLRRR